MGVAVVATRKSVRARIVSSYTCLGLHGSFVSGVAFCDASIWPPLSGEICTTPSGQLVVVLSFAIVVKSGERR